MDHSILAIELCIPFEPGSVLRRRLHELLRAHPPQATFADKAYFYQQVSQVLIAHAAQYEKGCWDYFNDTDRALRDHKMWSDGLFTREGARTAPSVADGTPFRQPGDPRYLTFTIALLLTQNSPTDLQLRGRCNIPEADLWRRGVFVHVLQSVPYVNFVSVKSDVAYLIPGDERWGLTREDLALPKFDYLRPIQG